MHDNRAMVAICDLLGFSNHVKSTPLSRLVDYDIDNINNTIKSAIPVIDPGVVLSEEMIMLNGLVGSAVFSDTVLIYSLANNKSGYQNLIDSVARLLSYPIMWPNYRFRIGIDYGEFYHNQEKGIYVGKAMVGANDLEKKQEWCGAAFTEKAKEQLNDAGVSSDLLTYYDVPVKDGLYENSLVINWTLANHEIISQEFGWLERCFDPEAPENAAIERKIRNTEQFHLDKCNQCRANRLTY